MMPNYIDVGGDKDNDDVKTARKITFPADSILNAVIQDGDVHELLRILNFQRSQVNLNQTNHTGLTALHHAVLANNVDSVKLLLTYGADVRAQDTHGFSPLHTAAALGFLQVTSLLVLFGADVFALTKQRELAIDVAKDTYVARLLSDEMCLRIHQELYWKSIICMKCKQMWNFTCKIILFIAHVTVLALSALWTRWKPSNERKTNSLQSKPIRSELETRAIERCDSTQVSSTDKNEKAAKHEETNCIQNKKNK